MAAMPTAAPLIVEVIRSNIVESTHAVDVAVVDGSGALVAWAGDPEIRAAFRSSAKPIQAAASLAAGWQPSDSSALAIACASHNGEAQHLEAVRGILSDAGLDESSLACPTAFPLREEDIATSGARRRLFHNCSGKHAAFVAACVAHGWPTDSYRDPGHPLQQLALEMLEDAAGTSPDALLVDGCGAPTPVFALSALARAFGTIRGSTQEKAMLAHPFLVGGTARLDSALLDVGVVTKAGAEGLSCALIETAQGPLAIALKVRDGAPRARGPAITLILETYAPGSTAGVPDDLRSPPTLGDGVPVGAAVARGALVNA